jgi:hypothetical protein
LNAAEVEAVKAADRSRLEIDEAQALARAEQAKRQIVLRQLAYDKSSALWGAFHPSVYSIKDDDIRALLSGMPKADIDALLAKA